jgi:hypothetical protein
LLYLLLVLNTILEVVIRVLLSGLVVFVSVFILSSYWLDISHVLLAVFYFVEQVIAVIVLVIKLRVFFYDSDDTVIQALPVSRLQVLEDLLQHEVGKRVLHHLSNQVLVALDLWVIWEELF